MARLSEKLKRLEEKAEGIWKKNKSRLPKIIGVSLAAVYLYGLVVRSIIVGIGRVWENSTEPLFSWNPIENIGAVFTPRGLMVTAFLVILYCLFHKKGYSLISGYKTVRDKERGIEILPEGTHGTSGWMSQKEMAGVLNLGSIGTMPETLFGKLDSGEYVGMKDLPGMSKNIIVYGAPGTGKSRGFVMPFIMQAVKRIESLILVDPKAEFYETFSEYLRSNGYYTRAYNLLDLFASDGWNCVMDTAQDINLVQSVAEIIIRNTSSENDRDDFWAKAEKNLLMALLHYVQTLTYPGTDKLLPPEERSLGTIYKILSTTSVQELDSRFRALPPNHPALPPYGIFRQAHKQIWGNIVIGLGNRLNVFQNKLVDSITKHNEIDLTLPGKQKCAYFCIISDQDSSLEFLSSMFFSLLFVKLFDFARSQRVEGIGVQHSGGPGGFFAQQGVADRGGAFAQAGPCQQNGVFTVKPAAQRPDVLRVDAAVSGSAAAAGAAFRRTGQHHLHHRLHAGQVDKARPGAESALGAESRRAPVGHTASRRQHTAKAALVGICLPPGQAVLCHFLCDLALHLASSLKKAIIIGTL